MKKAFYISSVEHFYERDGLERVRYYPVARSAEWIYDIFNKHSLKCIGMKQWSETEWEVLLKGKRQDIQNFVCDFSILAGKVYSLRETVWL